VYFCRYYPYKKYGADSLLKEEDSFFFHRREYNSMIRSSRNIAKKLKIDFNNDPLFSGHYLKWKKPYCGMPWQMMLIDWDGNVYPCCGGEEWFKSKVGSGEYHFGNLLREHVDKCWNSPTYIEIRKTCMPASRGTSIPECTDCHSTLYFKGPHLKNAHIMRRTDDNI
jgi:radical SAM protein with 4Fe4S-binding SPASM domain